MLRDNTVRCWGYNGQGQLGNGTTANALNPVTVTSLSGVAQITGGYYHTCALLSDGTVRCWGYNAYGQLGDGSTTNRTTPVAISSFTERHEPDRGPLPHCARAPTARRGAGATTTTASSAT